MIVNRTSKKAVLLVGAAIVTLNAQAALAGVNVNVNVGVPAVPVVVAPPPPVYTPPPPVYSPPPAPRYQPEIVVESDIQFVYPDALGFYVAVGVPYDLFYYRNGYFLYRDGYWYRAASSRGPWIAQRPGDLPRGLRRHRIERIRQCRDREYVIYDRDREHYRGRHFRSEKEQWKQQQREAREQRKEERRFEKEQRKEEKRWEKEQRKEDKRWEKEQRQEEKRHDKEERHGRREGHGD